MRKIHSFIHTVYKFVILFLDLSLRESDEEETQLLASIRNHVLKSVQ